MNEHCHRRYRAFRRETKRIIEAGMPGGKFLFGTGLRHCKIPEANIRAMLAAAYEFGSLEMQAA